MTAERVGGITGYGRLLATVDRLDPAAAINAMVPGPYRWQCRYIDGDYGEHTAWHYDVDDCGFASSITDALAAADAHLTRHRLANRLPPAPGPEALAYGLRVRARRLLARLRR